MDSSTSGCLQFQELSLEGMGLSAVPAQVWESSEIVKVDLSRNSIQELPPELTSCVCLQVNSYYLLVFVFAEKKIVEDNQDK